MSYLHLDPRRARRTRFVPVVVAAAVLMVAALPVGAASRTYKFSWMNPTSGSPTENSVTAGAVRGIRFWLDGDQGLAVLAPGWPRSQAYDCETGRLIPGTQTRTIAEGAGLRYDAMWGGTYTYLWQTAEDWGGSCRRFQLGLVDGSVHILRFRIRAFRFGGSVTHRPGFNDATAGSLQPIDFRLDAISDEHVFGPGAPRSAPIDCATKAFTGDWAPTAPRGHAGLSRTAATGEYHYRWQTRAAWDGTCRRFELRMFDGSRQTLLFRFGDVNDAPVVGPGYGIVDEHAPVGTVVGAPPPFTDADAGDHHTYALRTSGDPLPFEVDPATGTITVSDPAPIDFQEGTDHTSWGFTVDVTDDGTPRRTGSAWYVITVRDVNDAPVVTPATFSIAEDAPVGALVGDPVVANDVDDVEHQRPTVAFTITGGNDAGAFDIGAQTGQITVADAAALDHETLPVAELTVTATDEGDPAASGSATITVTVTDAEQRALPVGGTQNYLGVGHFVGATTTTTTTTGSPNDLRLSPTTAPSGTWSSPAAAYGTGRTGTTTSGAQQQWGGFGFPPYESPWSTLVADGIVVHLADVDLNGSGTPSDPGCRLQAELSWGAGAADTWSSPQLTPAIAWGTALPVDLAVGSSTSTAGWGSHVWTVADLSNTNLRVRLTWTSGPTAQSQCPSTRSVFVDDVDLQVYWHISTTYTTTTIGPKEVHAPRGGAALPSQGFWTAMQSQGSPSIQGDPYLTQYETRTSTLNTAYDPDGYYHYGIDVPEGATDGEVWLFDPGFCETSASTGTGESWTIGGANGHVTAEPVSAFFELFDTMGTPATVADDVRVDPTTDDDAFRRLHLSDATLGGTHGRTTCDDLAWHNGWWRLAAGLQGGRTYRLHAFSTDRNAPADQSNTTALNAFSIYASATGGTPRVYGVGAMETFVRLPGGQQTEFALTKVDARHAGEALVIELWDPGDTGGLAGSLQILMPTTMDHVPATFDWTARRGTTNGGASSCDGLSGTAVTAVVTNTGNASRFNGCWLTITVALPDDYEAPHPSSDTETTDGGWWKLRYTMGGSSTGLATDLTTWTARIVD